MKTKEAPPPPTNPAAQAQAQIRGNLPTPDALAALAATLAAGRPIDPQRADDLATQALTLWRAARRKINATFAADLSEWSRSWKWARQFAAVPVVRTKHGHQSPPLPMKWLEFGKFCCPKSKPDAVAKWLREWAEADGERVGQTIATGEDYYYLASRFLAWRAADEAAKAEARAKAGGVAKAKKQEEERLKQERERDAQKRTIDAHATRKKRLKHAPSVSKHRAALP